MKHYCKKLIRLFAAVTLLAAVCTVPALLLAGCQASKPDYTPVGDGMKAVGICLVVCAVIKALAELVKGDSNNSKGGRPEKGRKRPDDQSERR